ncbi:hypothetical protein BSKO_06970 [Bryopsis sp. KO-2023]|nr:hypothetical protein BSKO_06970 [Bryopsis sp. KO-2023]
MADVRVRLEFDEELVTEEMRAKKLERCLFVAPSDVQSCVHFLNMVFQRFRLKHTPRHLQMLIAGQVRAGSDIQLVDEALIKINLNRIRSRSAIRKAARRRLKRMSRSKVKPKRNYRTSAPSLGASRRM